MWTIVVTAISVNFAGGRSGGGFGPFDVTGSTGAVSFPNWNNPAGANNTTVTQINFPLQDSEATPNAAFLNISGIGNTWSSLANTSTDAGRLHFDLDTNAWD